MLELSKVTHTMSWNENFHNVHLDKGECHCMPNTLFHIRMLVHVSKEISDDWFHCRYTSFAEGHYREVKNLVSLETYFEKGSDKQEF